MAVGTLGEANHQKIREKVWAVTKVPYWQWPDKARQKVDALRLKTVVIKKVDIDNTVNEIIAMLQGKEGGRS